VNVLDDNENLKSIYTKLGFIEEDILHEHVLCDDGVYRDMAVLCLNVG